ncbi:MAG: pitrilysin family protein [Candidatus Micrarchaeaceae archaeon]
MENEKKVFSDEIGYLHRMLRKDEFNMQTPTLHKSTELYRLDNGLRVIIRHVAGLESVAIVLGVNYGSIDDSEEKNGTAHYLEHMLFRGTKNNSWKDISNILKDIGGYWNANTDFEVTLFYIEVHKSQMEKATKIIADIMQNATISKDSMETERKVIMAENRDDDLYLQNKITISLIRSIFQKYPVVLPIGGSNDKSLLKITREDLDASYKKYYNSNNMVLAIYGGVKKNETIELIRKYFSNLNGNGIELKRSTCKEKQIKDSKNINLYGFDKNVAAIGRGFMVEGLIDNPEEYAQLKVFHTLLQNRIYEEIREKKGLSYSPNIDVAIQSTFGYIIISAVINSEHIKEANDVLDKELQKFEEGKIDSKEIKIAKQQTYFRSKMAFDYIPEMPISLVVNELTMHKYYLPLIRPILIKNVSDEDIKKLCRKYIKLENAATITVVSSHN